MEILWHRGVAKLSSSDCVCRERERERHTNQYRIRRKKMSCSTTSLVFSPSIRLARAFSRLPFPPHPHPFTSPLFKRTPSQDARRRSGSGFSVRRPKFFPNKAMLSETTGRGQFPKVGAKSSGPIPPAQLIQVVEAAAESGARVVMGAVNKPRSISYKGLTDLVTDINLCLQMPSNPCLVAFQKMQSGIAGGIALGIFILSFTTRIMIHMLIVGSTKSSSNVVLSLNVCRPVGGGFATKKYRVFRALQLGWVPTNYIRAYDYELEAERRKQRTLGMSVCGHFVVSIMWTLGTDKMSEESIIEVVRKNFPDHLILGEEGGITGDPSSDYLWCIDPLAKSCNISSLPVEYRRTLLFILDVFGLPTGWGMRMGFGVDGTTNFAHGYPSFAVSVGVLFRGNPAAAAVVEFVGGHMCWNSRMFTATAGGGAFCNGEKIHVSKTDQVTSILIVD
ncbi:hypothetical protein CRG98_022790 [Punica granatum]|uniref:Uncharacterized protein n=1 Tax=Punica granatum TaxID=22663 RepID=A0A2I0JKN9_PUNGR|nr:hypothetical protein CRG98_022790 [Punica granatum]